MLSYTNKTYGDMFDVWFNPDGSFQSAHRYMTMLRKDPIVYTTLTSIPQPYRHEIEQLSHNYNNRKTSGEHSSISLV
jgi:hypothetical protein